MPTPTCWILTEGHAGMQNQCIGLAEALGIPYSIKQVRPRAPWKYMPPLWWRKPLSMVAPDTPLTAPWPDFVISCGRRSVATALAIRRAAGGKTVAIHIQDPYTPATCFDLIIVPEHDALRGKNVVVVRGALHHLTPQKLTQAAQDLSPQLSGLPRPVLSVLIGGPNRRQDFTPAIVQDFARKLAAAATGLHGALAITPSRRTGAEAMGWIAQETAAVPNFTWDGTGANPYFGLLALGDTIIVTSDSVSMMSEACATGKPVYIYTIPGGSTRLACFRDSLIAHGYARDFTGEVELWPGKAFNETFDVAALIRTRFADRF